MNQPKQTSPSISSPLSTVSSEDEDAGYLEAAEDYSREVSYEPSDNATPAATSANTDNDHQEAGPSTAKDKKKRASGTKRGKINRPTMSCDQCQRKKSELVAQVVDRHARASRYYDATLTTRADSSFHTWSAWVMRAYLTSARCNRVSPVSSFHFCFLPVESIFGYIGGN